MPEAPKSDVVTENNKQVLHFIEEVTTNADEIQKKVLAEILTKKCSC